MNTYNFENEESLKFKKSKFFVIYGAGKVGKSIYLKLKEYYDIRAFVVTKLGKEKEYMGLPVIQIDDLRNLYGDPGIIIGASGTFEEDIHKILVEKKFTNIIFTNEAIIEYLRCIGSTIGVGCKIYDVLSFGSEPFFIKLGNHVRVNEGVDFITHDGGVWVLRGLKKEYEDIDLFGKIEVGDNVHIGTNALIMPGVKIGNNCIIGAGSVVTKDVPDNCIYAGVPAKFIETIDEYIEKNKDKFVHTKKMTSYEKKEYLIKNKDKF